MTIKKVQQPHVDHESNDAFKMTNHSDQPETIETETYVDLDQQTNDTTSHPTPQSPNASILETEQAASDAMDMTSKIIDSNQQQLQRQLDEEHRQLLTTLADLANLRKRTEKEIVNARKYALENFAKDILETVDNLERSLAGANQQPTTLKEFYTGIELTLKSLKEVLTRYDIKEINPLNQPFDHQLHTAISMQDAATQDVATNTVISVIQKGYQLKDRLLRPAMVIVAK